MHLSNSSMALLTSCILAIAGCESESVDEDRDDETQQTQRSDQETADEGVDYRWMPESDAKKFSAIENQFAGFSEAMRKTGYRYVELYWAGEDRNWEYATYQLEKIEDTIERGLTRRPGRAASAQPFLENDIPALQQTIDDHDGEAFDAQFEEFTQACNTCHVMEDAAYIEIGIPDHRVSPTTALSNGD